MSKQNIGAASRLQGKTFEQEIESSFSNYCPFSWSMRIRDGGNGERPGDFIILTSEHRLLIEAKSTLSTSFNISALVKRHQLSSLYKFSKLNERNFGLLFIKFVSVSVVYVVEIQELVKFVKENYDLIFSQETFESSRLHCAVLTTDTQLIDQDLLTDYLDSLL